MDDFTDPVVHTLMREGGVGREDAELQIRRQAAAIEVIGAVEAAFPQSFGGAWLSDDIPCAVIALTEDASAWDHARDVIDRDELLRGVVQLVPAERSLHELEALRAEVVAAVRGLGLETMDLVDPERNAVVIDTVEDRPLTTLQRRGVADLRARHGETVIIRECTAPRFEPQ